MRDSAQTNRNDHQMILSIIHLKSLGTAPFDNQKCENKDLITIRNIGLYTYHNLAN